MSRKTLNIFEPFVCYIDSILFSKNCVYRRYNNEIIYLLIYNRRNRHSGNLDKLDKSLIGTT